MADDGAQKRVAGVKRRVREGDAGPKDQTEATDNHRLQVLCEDAQRDGRLLV